MISFKICFFFQGYIASLLGIGDGYYSNVASLFAFASSLNKNNSYSDILEISDTEIFGVGVRIYKPVNRTNQANEPDKQVLLPGLIYFHGGGWTLGSLGKPFSIAFICPRQLTILYIIPVGGLKTLSVSSPWTSPMDWVHRWAHGPDVSVFGSPFYM